MNPIRIVTAASLFDGHDASINIIRRMLQDSGAEVVHLGHNRSVLEVVTAALQEGAQSICMSSYQGGHIEYFKYMRDLLDQFGAPYVKIFGGGGGVIVYEEKKELEDYGITRIYHPDDGRRLGLEGMISEIIELSDYDLVEAARKDQVKKVEEEFSQKLLDRRLGLELTAIELKKDWDKERASFLGSEKPLVLGITGTGGAGKSSLVDELLLRFSNMNPELKVGVVCVDPTKRKTGGSLLGDRIRMNSLTRKNIFMRSLASRGSGSEVSENLSPVLEHMKKSGFDILIAETSGIGQANTAITDVADVSLYVMTSEFGAQSQLEKIDMIDFADCIAINKADRRGSEDALRDVRKQYRRSRKLFHEGEDCDLPVFLTQASNFNDQGVNDLFFQLCKKLGIEVNKDFAESLGGSSPRQIIPPERQGYLAEIAKCVRSYKSNVEAQAEAARNIQALERVKKLTGSSEFEVKIEEQKKNLSKDSKNVLNGWDKLEKQYSGETFEYVIRDKTISQKLRNSSLSGLLIPRVSFPKLADWGDRILFSQLENVPGQFPFTAGVFPLKREGEDPKRQFAGEGTPERTNKRFHYLSKNDEAKRLSTAFDSVTLYGEDPHLRPDIYGKVGESGVSICTLEDMKILYSGFDLCAPNTSVSMTINGPAPIILAFFMNAAIDQQIEIKEKKLNRTLNPEELAQIEGETLSKVRGTVQADILKEDQAQNTCIFSTDFALKMMGDIQEYFIEKSVRNFYSVSISGYHIAEAGANPISQTAFTLANGYTYVEYYLSRGMKIDDFAPNLSYFFSNGLDPEYAVIGRVARRIWAISMRDLYKASERSQKLKYHIQTSGRSLHAQEIDFNDIRTTLQALLAVYDNCNSLHTNAYDEAITTPTEESVRRAMAIQMIINKEFGPAKSENPNQGGYFFTELTDLVEEAILDEFVRINERGGVLGAMESQYQRGKIQEESLYYEHLKHSGQLPIIGVNRYVDPKTMEEGYKPPQIELARASQEEKETQLKSLSGYLDKNIDESAKAIEALKKAALSGENIFSALMKASRVCSLGQMSSALYEVGGQYRRSV